MATLVRWDPFREVAAVQNELSRLMNGLFEGNGRTEQSWVPTLDAWETDDVVVYAFDLPGVVQDEISVEVEEVGDKVVRANLLVETESQKQILVGKRGAMVREIGTRARPEVERLLGRSVFLEVVVKVRPRWRRDEHLLERLGL